MDTKSGRDDGPDVFAAAGVPENPAYRRRNPNLGAECIFFWLLKEDHTFERYFVDTRRPIIHHEMPDEIAKILIDIDGNRLETVDFEFECKRMSYFACVLRDNNHPTARLQRRNGMSFEPQNGALHRSFRDARDVDRLPRPYNHLSAFFCLNRMRRSNGRIIQRLEKDYFDIYFNHVHVVDGVTVARMRDHEDSSTNLGPPRPPPP
jgi:hypothetical protein